MITTILRPCPFCGKSPTSQATPRAEQYEGSTHAWAVWCANRRCAAQPEVCGATQAEAEKKWNTRAEVA